MRISLPIMIAAAALSVPAQGQNEKFLTGQAQSAWEAWLSAVNAVQQDDFDQVEEVFGGMLEPAPPAEPLSPLRLALLEQRATREAQGGGAILLLETKAKRDELGPNAQRIVELLRTGREQLNEANDGWYFASLGRFDIARANFEALLAQDPDPVALLEYADSVSSRQQMLGQLAGDPTVGEAVQQVMALLRKGEEIVKSDAVRIQRNIAKLSGTPRAYENGVALLKDSGEYAVPFLIETLRDRSRDALLRPVLLALPKIDLPAENPLVAALDCPDAVVKGHVIETLAKIGYPQALPYLLQLAASADTQPEIRSRALDAIKTIEQRNPSVMMSADPAEAFYELAQDFYNQRPALAADPRLETANVWYWRDDILQNTKVPTEVFDEVMAMRMCQKSLQLNPEHVPAQALWLAANFRREAQLGDREDLSRPEVFPPAEYFARSAGAERCQLTLARAVADGDPAVALGAIAALRKTGGAASLFGGENAQPLADALAFPDRMVRIQAALALAFARPEQPFYGYQNLMPVLSETLTLHAGQRAALVVDKDDAVANAVAAALRDDGFQVVTDSSVVVGLDKIRNETPGVDVIFLGADVSEPDLNGALARIRGEFRFASTPVVIIVKEGYAVRVREMVRADQRLGSIAGGVITSEAVLSETEKVTGKAGVEPVDAERGLELAVEAAEALYLLAVSKNATFNPADVEPALLTAFTNEDPTLRVAVARVLGYVPTARAQAAIAKLALDADVDKEMRVAMFAALADSAKRQGALLDAVMTEQLVKIAAADEDMEIRTAASQALGALSVPGDPASKIIRSYYRG